MSGQSREPLFALCQVFPVGSPIVFSFFDIDSACETMWRHARLCGDHYVRFEILDRNENVIDEYQGYGRNAPRAQAAA